MTIALASRGYLFPKLGEIVVQVGDGPAIVDQQVLSPDIDGGVAVVAEGPTITGSVLPGPEISGGGRRVEPEPEAPTISGGNKPKIG